KSYSSGMRSRLGFSIAAILQPDIFIIDEALSTGDLSFRQKATERIQEMMERAKAVVIVTHSMNFVEKVCTRAIWIEKGKLRADGKAEEVVAEYRKEMEGNDTKDNKQKVTKSSSKKTAVKNSLKNNTNNDTETKTKKAQKSVEKVR